MAVARRSEKPRSGVVPDPTPENHLAYLLARVHHSLQQSMDRALRTVDITPTQFYALAHIAQSPGLSSAELARGLLTSPQAVATLIKRMDTAGLIERDQPGRGLSGALRLTAAGRNTLDGAVAVAVAAEAAALGTVSAADRKHLRSTLQSLLDSLEHTTN